MKVEGQKNNGVFMPEAPTGDETKNVAVGEGFIAAKPKPSDDGFVKVVGSVTVANPRKPEQTKTFSREIELARDENGALVLEGYEVEEIEVEYTDESGNTKTEKKIDFRKEDGKVCDSTLDIQDPVDFLLTLADTDMATGDVVEFADTAYGSVTITRRSETYGRDIIMQINSVSLPDTYVALFDRIACIHDYVVPGVVKQFFVNNTWVGSVDASGNFYIGVPNHQPADQDPIYTKPELLRIYKSYRKAIDELGEKVTDTFFIRINGENELYSLQGVLPPDQVKALYSAGAFTKVRLEFYLDKIYYSNNHLRLDDYSMLYPCGLFGAENVIVGLPSCLQAYPNTYILSNVFEIYSSDMSSYWIVSEVDEKYAAKSILLALSSLHGLPPKNFKVGVPPYGGNIISDDNNGYLGYWYDIGDPDVEWLLDVFHYVVGSGRVLHKLRWNSHNWYLRLDKNGSYYEDIVDANLEAVNAFRALLGRAERGYRLGQENKTGDWLHDYTILVSDLDTAVASGTFYEERPNYEALGICYNLHKKTYNDIAKVFIDGALFSNRGKFTPLCLKNTKDPFYNMAIMELLLDEEPIFDIAELREAVRGGPSFGSVGYDNFTWIWETMEYLLKEQNTHQSKTFNHMAINKAIINETEYEVKNPIFKEIIGEVYDLLGGLYAHILSIPFTCLVYETGTRLDNGYPIDLYKDEFLFSMGEQVSWNCALQAFERYIKEVYPQSVPSGHICYAPFSGALAKDLTIHRQNNFYSTFGMLVTGASTRHTYPVGSEYDQIEVIGGESSSSIRMMISIRDVDRQSFEFATVEIGNFKSSTYSIDTNAVPYVTESVPVDTDSVAVAVLSAFTKGEDGSLEFSLSFEDRDGQPIVRPSWAKYINVGGNGVITFEPEELA